MNDQMSDLILSEIRGMRQEMNKGFTEVKERVTVVETVTEPFFANDGGLKDIEQDIKDLQKSKWMVVGGAMAISTVLHTVFKKLGF